VRKFKVVVANGLASKHYHSFSIDHVKPHKPDFFLSHDMDNLPVASLGIKLLN